MKHIIFIIAIFLTINCQAQYLGGSDDGNAYAFIFGTRLNGTIASFTVLYRAGNGDGYDKNTKTVLFNNNTLSFYQGGIGDGFSNYASTALLSGENLDAIFTGAEGDGFSHLVSNTTMLDGENLSILYSGKDGDGFAVNFLGDVLLQGFMTNLYEGGIGDGFAEAILPDILLIGFMTELYEGGSGDGFSSFISSGNLINGLIFALFNGGNGDGFAKDMATSSMTLDVIEELVRLDILLYPNPANHLVHLKPNEGTIIDSVELFDVSGKKIMINLSNNNTINVSNLSEGMYLLNIFTLNGHVSKKLIVKK
jgi:hypothetical protein